MDSDRFEIACGQHKYHSNKFTGVKNERIIFIHGQSNCVCAFKTIFIASMPLLLLLVVIFFRLICEKFAWAENENDKSKYIYDIIESRGGRREARREIHIF